eukprot:TRINITY_DN2321_c0_g1_i3.p1 TRINITY_DN2321_c0_g1~~TRINITY_DN2321_c0_g1_i3.p1  ORF type:complete len:234 (+),score=48.56 TRINITY_DN2321_c0_g1_i3:407-1108(+)
MQLQRVSSRTRAAHTVGGTINALRHLPAEIGNMRTLKDLWVSGCSLSEVPAALWTLAALERVALSQNPVAMLPSGISASGLEKLKELHLERCCTAQLPTGLQSLTGLEWLDIRRSRVSHLPMWLASMPMLQDLQCRGCPLQGVALAGTVATFDELASVVSDTSDPERLQDLGRSLLEMTSQNPLCLLRTALMQFAPRTPLRQLCVSQCVAKRRVDLERLPTHIQDEIARAGAQ